MPNWVMHYISGYDKDLYEKYKGKEVKKVRIYPVLSREMENFDISDELIYERQNKINEVANKISNEEFSENNFDFKKCEKCIFKFICNDE